MILHVLFIGDKAQQLADKVKVPGIEQFRVEGTVVLPTKGDRVTLQRKDSVEGAWLMCAGRRFDFNTKGEPVVYLGLQWVHRQSSRVSPMSKQEAVVGGELCCPTSAAVPDWSRADWAPGGIA